LGKEPLSVTAEKKSWNLKGGRCAAKESNGGGTEKCWPHLGRKRQDQPIKNSSYKGRAIFPTRGVMSLGNRSGGKPGGQKEGLEKSIVPSTDNWFPIRNWGEPGEKKKRKTPLVRQVFQKGILGASKKGWGINMW